MYEHASSDESANSVEWCVRKVGKGCGLTICVQILFEYLAGNM